MFALFRVVNRLTVLSVRRIAGNSGANEIYFGSERMSLASAVVAVNGVRSSRLR